MKLSRRFAVVALLVLTVAVLTLSAQKSAKSALSSKATSNPKLIARGKYLVEEAGQCQDCHSPRNEKGDYVKQQWLGGSPVMFKPTVPIPVWAEQAPRIAGLPGFTDEEVIKILTTGVTPSGMPPRPPMPSYRFSREDATAITAYLRSLNTETTSAQNKQAGEKKQ